MSRVSIWIQVAEKGEVHVVNITTVHVAKVLIEELDCKFLEAKR